jgi:hypothetical protein
MMTISLAMLPYLPYEQAQARMAELVDRAAESGADLVAFPEVCTNMGSPNPWQGEPLDGPTLQAMGRKAKQQGIYIVCPLLTLEEGRLFNTALLIGRDGSLVGHYHKVFPTHHELNHGIIPGEETPVFETDLGRVGLAICFDLNYWEVGSGLGANRAELVIWPSMWRGARMLTRWSIEFGFAMASVSTDEAMVVDLIGREQHWLQRSSLDRVQAAPLLTQTLDLDRRVLHHDYNLNSLPALFRTYGENAAYVEHLSHECLVVFGSQMLSKSSDDLIDEFGLETMRDYLARARRDRKLALEGAYKPFPDCSNFD